MIWFTPVLMSYVVVGIIWGWIYDYDWGVVNIVLRLARARLARSIPGSGTRHGALGGAWWRICGSGSAST